MINDINIRVKEVRLSMELSQAKFAQKIGFSQGGINDIEKGKCGVSDRLILSMNEYLGVNKDWLRTGEGSMYAQSDAPVDYVQKFAEQMNLSNIERNILSIYLKLSNDDRKKFEDFANAFAQKAIDEHKKNTPDAVSEAENESKVAESPAEYKTKTSLSELDKTAQDLHRLIDEMTDAKAKEPSASDSIA